MAIKKSKLKEKLQIKKKSLFDHVNLIKGDKPKDYYKTLTEEDRKTFNRYATRPVSLYMYLKRKLITKCNIRFTGKCFASNLYSLNDFYERYYKKNFRYKYQIDDK